jgi:3-dehydroquinate synthase
MHEFEYTVQSGELVRVCSGSDIFESKLREICFHKDQLWAVDHNVYELHGALLDRVATELKASVHVVPSGEISKSRLEKERMEDAAFAAGLARDGLIVAIGGGVVGDLAGYVAATYMRGIDFVQVPTTVVAMVDSSIGGKTGIDVPQGKNLVGAFKHPIAIVADIDFLATLPDAEFRDGFAEVIKHAAIRDEGLFRQLEQHRLEDYRESGLLTELVVHNQKIKIGVVTADTREAGLRKILNFGHTLGHSIEALAKFQRSHGVCVAEGMVLEAMLGADLGVGDSEIVERLQALLTQFGFEEHHLRSSFSAMDLVRGTKTDKKVASGEVHYVLLESVGTCANLNQGCSQPVSDDAVLATLGSRSA